MRVNENFNVMLPFLCAIATVSSSFTTLENQEPYYASNKQRRHFLQEEGFSSCQFLLVLLYSIHQALTRAQPSS